jgi:hypothetical protein
MSIFSISHTKFNYSPVKMREVEICDRRQCDHKLSLALPPISGNERKQQFQFGKMRYEVKLYCEIWGFHSLSEIWHSIFWYRCTDISNDSPCCITTDRRQPFALKTRVVRVSIVWIYLGTCHQSLLQFNLSHRRSSRVTRTLTISTLIEEQDLCYPLIFFFFSFFAQKLWRITLNIVPVIETLLVISGNAKIAGFK